MLHHVVHRFLLLCWCGIQRQFSIFELNGWVVLVVKRGLKLPYFFVVVDVRRTFLITAAVDLHITLFIGVVTVVIVTFITDHNALLVGVVGIVGIVAVVFVIWMRVVVDAWL